MAEIEHGQVVSVDRRTFGSQIHADTATAETTLTVDDAADFDEDGGTLVINDQVIAYTAVDDDTGDITLAAGLDDDALEGDAVEIYDPAIGAVFSELVAVLAVDDDLDNTEPIEATVPNALADRLPEGVRGDDGESVSIIWDDDDDEWLVQDILGQPARIDGNFLATGTVPPPTDNVVPGPPTNLTTIPALGLVFVRWTPPTANADGGPQADAASYKVYVGAAGETTVAQDGAHLLAETSGTMIAATTLADGTPLAYEDADGNVLDYPFAVSAVDNDGESVLSDVVVGHMDKTGAADLIVGDVLAAVIEAIVVRGEVFSTRARDAGTGDLIGPGWTMDATSITEYDQLGDAQTELKLGTSTFRGNAVIDFLTVLLGATFDADVTVTPGHTLALGGGAAGVSNPGTPPTYAIGYATQQFTNDIRWGNRLGWSTDGTYWYTARSDSGRVYVEKWDASGAEDASFAIENPADLTVHGSCVGGSAFYIVVRTSTGAWHIYKVDLATFAAASVNVLSGTTAQMPDGSTRGVALGYDSVTSELLLAQSRATNSDKVRIRRYTYATSTWGSSVDSTHSYAFNLSHILYGSFDLGASRYIFGAFTSSGNAQVINTSGVLQTTEQWPFNIAAGLRGMDYASSAFTAMSASGLAQTYETGSGNRWTTSTDATWYAAYAWTNGSDHTATSNYVTIPMLKRARLTVTTPNLPAGVTGATIYLSKGSSTPDVTTTSMRDNGDAA